MVPYVTSCRTWHNILHLCCCHYHICIALFLNVRQIHLPCIFNEHLHMSLEIISHKSTCGSPWWGIGLHSGSRNNILPIRARTRYGHFHKECALYESQTFPCMRYLESCRECDSSVDTADFWRCLVISTDEFQKQRVLVVVMDGVSYDRACAVPLNELCIVLNNKD